MKIVDSIKNFFWPQKEVKPPYEGKLLSTEFFPVTCGYYWVISKDVKNDVFDGLIIELVYLYYDGQFGVFRIADMKRYQMKDFIWLSYYIEPPKQLEDIVTDLRDGSI